MIDSYVKLINDHPLLSYLEDPFAEADFAGMRKLKEALKEKAPQVEVGLKNIFKSSDLQIVKELTKFEELTEEDLEAERNKQPTPDLQPPPVKQKGAPSSASPDSTDKSKKNWDKFTPHAVHISTGNLSVLSELFDYCRYNSELPLEQQFTIVIDDRVYEAFSPDQQSHSLDLALGLGCSYLAVKGLNKPERIAKAVSLYEHY